MFSLQREPLDIATLKAQLQNPRAGACATFEGWVRNHNEGHDVQRLEYEAYDALCHSEAERILTEARERFGLLKAYCVHRIGALEIGDLAVCVGVSSPHRGESFDACRYIIDEVKHRLPIWKKEFYANGDSGWVNCERCASHEHASPAVTEKAFYERQVILPDVGIAGQARLKESRVLVIGAGGLGCPALSYLAAAGVGTLGICESDLLEASNLHRQVLYDAADVGKPKAELAAARLRAQNPHVTVAIHPFRLNTKNARELFAQYDLILDCTDNFDTKFLINDTAVALEKPAVFASIYQYEGQMQVYRPGETPCLRCLWPETPEAGCIGSCAEVGVLGAVPAVFGSLQAMEALKLILGLGSGKEQGLVLLNLLTCATQRIEVRRSASCPVCGETPTRVAIAAADDALGEIDIDLSEFGPEERESYAVVDIREVEEINFAPITALPHTSLPASELDLRDLPMEREGQYVICCAHGIRSRMVARRLRELGYKAYSQRGGVQRLNAALSARDRLQHR